MNKLITKSNGGSVMNKFEALREELVKTSYWMEMYVTDTFVEIDDGEDDRTRFDKCDYSSEEEWFKAVRDFLYRFYIHHW